MDEGSWQICFAQNLLAWRTNKTGLATLAKPVSFEKNNLLKVFMFETDT